MRLLFNSEGRGFDEIMREGELSKLELVSVLSFLKRNRLIRKTTNGKGTIYNLTPKGQIKLSYYEFTFRLYEQWRPRWCEGEENDWQNHYYEDVSELIKKSNYFGYENYFK